MAIRSSADLVRKQVYLTPEALDVVRDLSSKLGLHDTAVIKLILDAGVRAYEREGLDGILKPH